LSGLVGPHRYHLLAESTILEDEWLGHVVIRMEDTRIPKMMFKWSWKTQVKMGRLKAEDRKEWMMILREAKAKLKEP
jgi:exonuclease I